MESNKKGMEISLNFVIIAVLALVALIVIALFFTGGMSRIIGKEKTVVELTEQDIALAESACKLSCTLCQKGQFDNPAVSQAMKDRFAMTSTGDGALNCEEMPNVGARYWDKNCRAKCEAK